MSVRAIPHTHYQEGIKDSLKVIRAHVLYAIYTTCVCYFYPLYYFRIEEFIMTNFNTNLDKAFTKALEAEGVTIKNNQIDLDKVYKYTELADARDILWDVVHDSTEDNSDLVEKFNNLNVKIISDILIKITNDDYIIGDWGYYTDQHEYTPDTQNIITEETGIEF